MRHFEKHQSWCKVNGMTRAELSDLSSNLVRSGVRIIPLPKLMQEFPQLSLSDAMKLKNLLFSVGVVVGNKNGQEDEKKNTENKEEKHSDQKPREDMWNKLKIPSLSDDRCCLKSSGISTLKTQQTRLQQKKNLKRLRLTSVQWPNLWAMFSCTVQ